MTGLFYHIIYGKVDAAAAVHCYTQYIVVTGIVVSWLDCIYAPYGTIDKR